MSFSFGCSISTAVKAGVAIIVLAAAPTLQGCASSKTLGDGIDDFNAAQTVRRSLITDRSRDYSDIDITMFEGRLLLTGTMRSEDGRQQLVANAWKAQNVKQVIDEIFVGDKTSIAQGIEDGRIDAAIGTKLLTDRGVTSNDYEIAVSGGVVYMIGVARDELALTRALNHARSTAGVKKVVSHVIYKDDPSRNPGQYSRR